MEVNYKEPQAHSIYPCICKLENSCQCAPLFLCSLVHWDLKGVKDTDCHQSPDNDYSIKVQILAGGNSHTLLFSKPSKQEGTPIACSLRIKVQFGSSLANYDWFATISVN